MRAVTPSIAAAIVNSRAATAVVTVASSVFMKRAMSRVGRRSMSASSGRYASVVMAASCSRNRPLSTASAAGTRVTLPGVEIYFR